MTPHALRAPRWGSLHVGPSDGPLSLMNHLDPEGRSTQPAGSTAEQRKWHIYKAEFPATPTPASYRFVGRWATEARNCSAKAWRFTADRLSTPAGSQCTFHKVSEVPGGYDIAARCTAEGPPRNDTLELRFAASAKALLFDSDVIADAGLVRCP